MIKRHTIAIIPARGGSKSIKKKNIHFLAGKELIAYTIEAALKSKLIDDVYVTSDDDEILQIANKYGALTIKRPDALAKDDTKTEPVISHLLSSIDNNYETLVLLQPTSPLRDENDIDTALDIYFKSDADALISVFIPEHSPFKAFTKDENGHLKGILNNEFPFMPRQKLPVAYYPNGAIYIREVEEFLKDEMLFGQKTIPFEMDKQKSLDIDSIEELYEIEKMIKG